jgi:Tol biopolymer transport system component
VCLLLILCFCRSVSSYDHHELHQFAQITAGPMGEIGPRCSQDRRLLAFEYFSSAQPNAVQVWLMPTKGKFADAKPLLGDTEKSYGEISWSPDGVWLSFIGGSPESGGILSDQVFKINVANRQITQLTHLPAQTALGGTSWSRDGRILFEMDDDLYTVPQIGGAVVKLVNVQAKLPGVSPGFPSWSPDGSRVAFVGRGRSSGRPGAGHDLYIVDLPSGKIAKILAGLGDDAPSWLDQDRILCSRIHGAAESSIWLVHVSRGSAVRLTKGSFDISPAVCPGERDVYFARNMHVAPSRFLMEGFHIWRFKLKRSIRLATTQESD